jgi:hypothetical protein
MVTLCGLGGGRGERVTCCSVEEALLQVHSVCVGLASGTGIKPTCATTPRGNAAGADRDHDIPHLHIAPPQQCASGADATHNNNNN